MKKTQRMKPTNQQVLLYKMEERRNLPNKNFPFQNFLVQFVVKRKGETFCVPQSRQI